MNINEIKSTGTRATREGFGQGLLELGRQNSKVVGLTADLIESLLMQHFKAEFPERFFELGIAEANMMGIAAGLTALVSLAVREGHVCLHLGDEGVRERLAALGLDGLDGCLDTGVIGTPGSATPLILDGERLYFSRFFRDEAALARVP